MLNQVLKNSIGAVVASDGIRFPFANITAFLVATYGSTPTFSVQLEGGPDGATWFPIPTIDGSDAANTPTTNAISHTYTSGASIVLISLRLNATFEWYRINITANTNVTVDAWLMGCETS